MTIQERLGQLDWKAIEASLWQRGYAKTDPLLTAQECDALITLYTKDRLFRSRIDMKRFRFGEGEYKYFAYPLPSLVQVLRETIYPRLAVIANAWAKALGQPDNFPLSHEKLLACCRRNGQTKPTPLLLRYGAGGHNTPFIFGERTGQRTGLPGGAHADRNERPEQVGGDGEARSFGDVIDVADDLEAAPRADELLQKIGDCLVRAFDTRGDKARSDDCRFEQAQIIFREIKIVT